MLCIADTSKKSIKMTWPFRDVHINLLTIASLVAILHLCALILLLNARTKLKNQRLIMINLSLTELMYCMDNVLIYSVEFATQSTLVELKNRALLVATSSAVMMFTMANKFVVLYLIVDRFLDIFFHMKYPLYFTKFRVKCILCLLWVTSIIYGLTLAAYIIIRRERNFSMIIHNYVSLCVDACVTVTAVTTYAYFYKKTRRMPKGSIGSAQNRSTSFVNPKFLVPFLVIFTYLLFNVSSSITFQVWRLQERPMKESDIHPLYITAQMMAFVGFLADGLLHIILQKDVRTHIFRTLRRRRVIRRDVDSIYHMSTF